MAYDSRNELRAADARQRETANQHARNLAVIRASHGGPRRVADLLMRL